jgi:hypothetical protein
MAYFVSRAYKTLLAYSFIGCKSNKWISYLFSGSAFRDR